MKRKLFWIAILINLALTLADGILTYIGTPNLRFEYNPLVYSFGFGWMSLLISNIIGFAFYILCAYYTLIKYKRPHFKVNSFNDYVSMLLYDKSGKKSIAWYQLPKNVKPYLSATAFAFMVALPIARLITVSEWCIHLTNRRLDAIYSAWRIHLPFNRLDLLVAFVTVIFSLIYWLFKEYCENKKFMETHLGYES